ncbi:MAG: NAD(P)-dependent oxidoreductase [Planctomycetaceae bacterium]|nr:NAD(P)-dependent oxidoreductase [Planctomycetaceae bacterium]
MITKDTQIGWIGTGIMGLSMAMKIREAGYRLTVFNRTKQKAEALLANGAAWADSPREVAEKAEIVFLMVGYPGDVRETILGNNGLLSASPLCCRIIADMTTSSPSLAVDIEKECKKYNVVSLDAPVSGGDIGARNGTLSIMVGGDKSAFDELLPLWNLMGKTLVYHGQAGGGQHTKMVNQTLIAGTMLGLCEALVYAAKSGLDLEKVLQSVSTGAAGSWALSNLAPRVLKGDFAPGFIIEHIVKDLGIVLEESRRMGLDLQATALAERMYQLASEKGFSRNGTQALYRVLRGSTNED